jgi:hypothetical protein
MTPKPPKDIDTGELDAITEEVRDEVTAELETPAPARGISSETIRRLARNEARPIARTEVRDHADECEHSGPLCAVAKKVDDLRVAFNRWAGALALLCILMPVGIAVWTNQRANSRAEESLRDTIKAAKDVAEQLKAVQDAAKSGHTQLAPVRLPMLASHVGR